MERSAVKGRAQADWRRRIAPLDGDDERSALKSEGVMLRTVTSPKFAYLAVLLWLLVQRVWGSVSRPSSAALGVSLDPNADFKYYPIDAAEVRRKLHAKLDALPVTDTTFEYLPRTSVEDRIPTDGAVFDYDECGRGLAKPQAYVGILSGDGVEYLGGMMALMQSLKDTGTKRELALVVTDTVSETTRCVFRAMGVVVVELAKAVHNPNCKDSPGERLDNSKVVAGKPCGRIAHNYSKVTIFGLSQYDRIVYMDADVMVKENIDELFCTTGLAVGIMSHDSSTVRKSPSFRKTAENTNSAKDGRFIDKWEAEQHRTVSIRSGISMAIGGLFEQGRKYLVNPLLFGKREEIFNSGLMVLTPSRGLFEDMIEKSAYLKSYNRGDQGFIATYFHQADAPYGLEPVCRGCYNLKNSKSDSCPAGYIGELRDGGTAGSSAKVIHFMDQPKPWRSMESSEGKSQCWGHALALWKDKIARGLDWYDEAYESGQCSASGDPADFTEILSSHKSGAAKGDVQPFPDRAAAP